MHPFWYIKNDILVTEMKGEVPAMDYFKFIHSGDVREHLRRINYPLSSLEAAWLVWENDIVSIKEKHAAWEEIIRTMPDCMIEERYQIRKWC